MHLQKIIGFSAIAIFITICIVCCGPSRKVVQPQNVNPNPESVVAYLQKVDYTNTWARYPGQGEVAKRLGLPVHGRWVKTYVNPIAHDYLKKIKDGKVEAPFDFPVGSFIVKDNYRSKPKAAQINRDQSKRKVLTILFKPKPELIKPDSTQTKPYNGKDFLGGGWFYGFYMLSEPDNPEMQAFARKMNKKVQSSVSAFCVNCHAPASNYDYVRTLQADQNQFFKSGQLSYCESLIKSTDNPASKKAKTSKEAEELRKKLDDWCQTDPISPAAPADVPFDPEEVFELLGSEKTQQMFDCFAWKSFVALNWVNQGKNNKGKPQRGVPNTNQSFFTERNGQATVWETFKPTYEFFQPNRPSWNPVGQAWDQYPPKIAGKSCECKPEENLLTLTMGSKAREASDESPNETGQAFAGSFGYLIDRNHNRVRYEVLVNRTEFEFLIKDGKAATKNLTPSGPNGQKVKFPDNLTDDRKVGSMEIKSAWKELVLADAPNFDPKVNIADAKNRADAHTRFYVREVLIYDEPTDSCWRALAGLVGLHITHKTHFAPQWIWMTFEHKDNVPEYSRTDQEASFFDPNRPASDTCWNYPFLYPGEDVANCPNVDLNRFVPNLTNQPNQLTRLAPVQAQAAEQNTRYRKLLKGSPFANYLLVDTQWPLHAYGIDGQPRKSVCPDNGIGKDCFTMVPRYLRNTVVESYMSTYCEEGKGKRQFSNRSCMGCHGEAGNDFSYIYLDAVSQRVNLTLSK